MKHPGMINKVSNISDEIFNWSEDTQGARLKKHETGKWPYTIAKNGEKEDTA